MFLPQSNFLEVDTESEVGVQDFLLDINTSERKEEDKTGKKRKSNCDKA